MSACESKPMSCVPGWRPARFELTSMFRVYPASFIRSTDFSNVPEGASSLVSWWISQAHAPYSGWSFRRRAASATRRKKTCTPIEKFGLHTRPDAAVINGFFDAVEVLGPACSTDDCVDLKGSQLFDVTDYGFRHGELDGNVDMFEGFRSDGVVLVDGGSNLDAELGRKLADKMAHLAVTYEADSHAANTAASGSRKNSV